MYLNLCLNLAINIQEELKSWDQSLNKYTQSTPNIVPEKSQLALKIKV